MKFIVKLNLFCSYKSQYTFPWFAHIIIIFCINIINVQINHTPQYIKRKKCLHTTFNIYNQYNIFHSKYVPM